MKFYIPGIVLFCTTTLVTLMSMTADHAPASEVAIECTTARSLYDSIAVMDAAWEDAYNHCKLQAMDSMISEDLEFYHDQGGVTTSKQAIMAALQQNICGKVSRQLKAGSIEVYPIANFGAVEMGLHTFHNNQEPDAKPHYSKFVHLWKRENGRWRMTRVISLH